MRKVYTCRLPDFPLLYLLLFYFCALKQASVRVMPSRESFSRQCAIRCFRVNEFVLPFKRQWFANTLFPQPFYAEFWAERLIFLMSTLTQDRVRTANEIG